MASADRSDWEVLRRAQDERIEEPPYTVSLSHTADLREAMTTERLWG